MKKCMDIGNVGSVKNSGYAANNVLNVHWKSPVLPDQEQIRDNLGVSN